MQGSKGAQGALGMDTRAVWDTPSASSSGFRRNFSMGRGLKTGTGCPGRGGVPVLSVPGPAGLSALRAGCQGGDGSEAGLCSRRAFLPWPVPCLTPAVPTAPPVQAGPATGAAAGGAHPDQGQHHAGPVALHQTQQTAGQPREGVHQLQPLLPPGTGAFPPPAAPPGSACAPSLGSGLHHQLGGAPPGAQGRAGPATGAKGSALPPRSSTVSACASPRSP